MTPDPTPLHGDPGDDPTAALLRDVLHRQADAVRPSPDGLSRIRAEIAGRRPRVLPLHRGSHLTPLLATAAALVVVAGGGTAAVRAVANRNAPSMVTVAQVQSQIDHKEVEDAPAASLPVYVAGRQNGKVVLFREFRKVKRAGDADDQVAAAVRLAITTPPRDADYTQLFAPAPSTTVNANVAYDHIDLDISPAPGARSPAPTPQEARAALQQILWTATATAAVAAGEGAPNGGRSVRITLDGGTDEKLFGQVPVGAAAKRDVDIATDPRAKAWISNPAEGVHARGTLDADGQAVAINRPSVLVRLSRDGEVVRSDLVPLTSSESSGGRRPPLPGQRGTWAISGWDVSTPGLYVLEVFAPATAPAVAPATGQNPGDGHWTDSKTFTVE